MQQSQANSVAFVTGGASFLGAAIVRCLKESGFKVAIADTDEAASSLASELGDGVQHFRCNVRDEQSIKDAMQAAEDGLGPITSLVNNAALCRLGGPPHLTDELAQDYDDHFAVNTRGAFLCIQEVARRMQDHSIAGAIVNVTSVAGMRGMSFENCGYAVTMAALQGMTAVAAAKLAPLHIRVNSVAPSPLKSSPLVKESGRLAVQGGAFPDTETFDKMVQFMFAPLYGSGLPEATDVAYAVEFLLSDRSRHMTGVNLPVDQGLIAGAVNMPPQ